MKRFVQWFFIGMVISGMMIAGINYILDPFGAFGDRVTNFHSYNINNNPRVAKIGYLERFHDRYDSYVVGGSKSSGISPKLLNELIPGANFYNMMMYGGDFFDYEQTIHYLVTNYEVKNIVLHMSMQEYDHYNQGQRNHHTMLSGKVLGQSDLLFDMTYLFKNLDYSLEKAITLAKKKLGIPYQRIFIPELGIYDKSIRDQENLGTMRDYLKKYPMFEEPLWALSGDAVQQNIEAVARIKSYLDQHGIALYVIAAPTYSVEMQRYPEEGIRTLWRGIAEVTDFWDFAGYEQTSFDPTLYYDPMHYRYELGERMLHAMFETNGCRSMGYLVTADNVETRLNEIFQYYHPKDHIPFRRVPIVMYHDVHPTEQTESIYKVTVEKFEQDLRAYQKAGYQTIHFSDLIEYVYHGASLPEKPLILTFDDGYINNYRYAYPVLRKLNMKAVFSPIGFSIGNDGVQFPNASIKYSWDQMKEMAQSGLIEFQSHSYDLHKVFSEDDTVRRGVLQKSGETLPVYQNIIENDCRLFSESLEEHGLKKPSFFVYPYGFYDQKSEELLKDCGFFGTVIIEEGINIVGRNPETLFRLKRYNADHRMSPQQIIDQFD